MPSARADVRSTTVVYALANGVQLTGDLFTPAGSGPFHALVMVHGGGWMAGDKSELETNGWVDEYLNQGYVVFAINYRLACDPADPPPEVSDPALCGYHAPKEGNDVRKALAYVYDHAAAWGIDPAHIAIWGTSAGGDLSMLTAATGTVHASAVVALSGKGDLIAAVNDHVINYVGCDPSVCPTHTLNASPALLVAAGAAPLYLSGGEFDTIVPQSDEQETVNAWTSVGSYVQWHLVPGSSCHALGCVEPGNLKPSIDAFLATYG
jgi:acetyl esterase/lipase